MSLLLEHFRFHKIFAYVSDYGKHIWLLIYYSTKDMIW